MVARYGRILLVEDTKSQRELMRDYVEAQGYEVQIAATGAEALAAAAAEVPDAVLLDWELPDYQGLELIRIWRRDAEMESVPVLVVTARNRSQDIAEALEVGATDFVRKPLGDMLELGARLSTALRIKTLQDRLRKLASHDPLTGLLNRRALMERLGQEVQRAFRYGHDLALVMADIDHFKRINDEQGHDAGDRVLAQAASFLRKHMRETDIVGRYGGEEFVLLLPETDSQGAFIAMDRMRQAAVDRRWGTRECPSSVRFSLGLASFLDLGLDSAEGLLKAADEALYQAKEGGRNQVVQAVRP
ncbi:MAG: diguanylate cyclase [bacterium]|nr:diguanylate cyclase [bacterium]